MRVFKKLLALTLALTLALSMGTLMAVAAPNTPSISIYSSLQSEVGSTSTIPVTSTGLSTIVWSSSEPTVATVQGDINSATIKCLTEGRTTVTASSEDGSLTVTCSVEVVKKGMLYWTPGDVIKFDYTNFIRKSDGTDMPNLLYGFTDEYLDISFAYLEGAKLVQQLYVDVDECAVLLQLKSDYSLVYPKNPNLIFDNVTLTAKKDFTVGNVSLKVGDVFVMKNPMKRFRVGYPEVTRPLGASTTAYTPQVMHNFIADNGFKTGTADIHFQIGDVSAAYLSGTVKDGDKILVDHSLQGNRAVRASNPTGILYFFNLYTNGFPTAHQLMLAADSTDLIYKIENNKLVDSGLVWSDVEYAWVGNITTSVSYVVADQKLNQSTDGDGNPSTGGGDNTAAAPSENVANTPETAERVSSTVAALADPTKTLPAGTTTQTTAGGAAVTAIPVKLENGSAQVGSALFTTLGEAPATVALQLTISDGLVGGSAQILLPGGFGKITEPGRIFFPMNYANKAEEDTAMRAAVKGENAASDTALVGGDYTLPTAATVTVGTTLPEGSTANIFKYDPATLQYIALGKSIVKNGQLTFSTKIMGQLLFTTGTV